MKADHRAARLTSVLLFASTAVATTACADDFDPYNLVSGEFRVLALRADPPWLGPGSVATVEPLIYVDEDAAQPELEWSWCPVFTSGECVVTAEEIGDSLGFGEVSFELGSGPAASLPFLGTASDVTNLCDTLLGEEWPAFVERPDCDQGITVTVQLDASTASRVDTAVKEVRLSLDGETHANPWLTALRAVEAEDALLFEPEESFPLDPSDPPVLELGTTYQLIADLPAAAAEPYVDAETGEELFESLVVTWFVTAGETDDTRTRWYVDAPEISGRSTGWTLPDAEDTDDDEALVVVVVRDDRGGLGWLERRVRLAP